MVERKKRFMVIVPEVYHGYYYVEAECESEAKEIVAEMIDDCIPPEHSEYIDHTDKQSEWRVREEKY